MAASGVTTAVLPRTVETAPLLTRTVHGTGEPIPVIGIDPGPAVLFTWVYS
jgi:hypothetical protein